MKIYYTVTKLKKKNSTKFRKYKPSKFCAVQDIHTLQDDDSHSGNFFVLSLMLLS